MDTYIAFNDYLGTLEIPMVINGIEFSVTGHFIWGIFLMCLATCFQKLSATGLSSWWKAIHFIKPSDSPSPAPIITTTNGCVGLISNGFTWPMMWICLAMGLDQVLLAGKTLIFIIQLQT